MSMIIAPLSFQRDFRVSAVLHCELEARRRSGREKRRNNFMCKHFTRLPSLPPTHSIKIGTGFKWKKVVLDTLGPKTIHRSVSRENFPAIPGQMATSEVHRRHVRFVKVSLMIERWSRRGGRTKRRRVCVCTLRLAWAIQRMAWELCRMTS